MYLVSAGMRNKGQTKVPARAARYVWHLLPIRPIRTFALLERIMTVREEQVRRSFVTDKLRGEYTVSERGRRLPIVSLKAGKISYP